MVQQVTKTSKIDTKSKLKNTISIMWNKERLQELIENEIEENIYLDYKGSGSLGKSDGKKKEISKDVSAFANSAGGKIIYGISEYNQPNKSHLPEKLDPIDRLEFTKEWLEQVIYSNISPRIDGLIIHVVGIGEVNENKVVYIVEIPQSNTVHQAKDFRYYKRYNFKSIPMEDYQVKDIINRAIKKEVELIFVDENENSNEWSNAEKDFNITAKIWASNTGTQVVEIIQIFVCGSENTSKFFLEPQMNESDNFQISYSNLNKRKAYIGGEEIIVSIDRTSLPPKTRLLLGQIEFNSKLISDEHEIQIHISTENSFKQVDVKGIEIMQTIK